MSDQKNQLVLKSNNFEAEKEHPIKMEFTLTFGEHLSELEKDLQVLKEEEHVEINDTLFIKFKSTKPMTEEVQNYIEENLGMFELIEEDDKKIFVFELKINDIDMDNIQRVYKDYFDGKLNNFYVELLFEKNQTLDEMFQNMKENYVLPFVFQVMDKAQLRLKINDQHQLLSCFANYISKMEMPFMKRVLSIIRLFKHFSGEVTLESLEWGKDSFLKEMDIDQ